MVEVILYYRLYNGKVLSYTTGYIMVEFYIIVGVI